jgi:hypothetical protein
MMEKISNAVLYIGLATTTTAALAASSDESPTNHVLLNNRVVPVETSAPWVKHPPMSLEQAAVKAANHESSENGTTMPLNTPFMPLEGIYDKSKTHYERLCTVPDSPNAVQSVTSIVDVDSENATFIIRETSPDNPDLVFDTPCELYGQIYHCEMPAQEIDFAAYGLDALLTIEGSEYGFWKKATKHIHIPQQSFTCEGQDCGSEPASNLFGTLVEEMPCTSMAIYQYEWKSALPSQSDANLLIKYINTNNQGQLDTRNLATEAFVDSANRFEAVLFDYQSQQTLASLVWNDDKGLGKITFDVDDRKDEVSLQIAEIKDMPSFERYNILLQGLHEAGIAWLSQQSGLSAVEQEDKKQQSAAQVNPITHGAIDSISQSSVNSSDSEDTQRYAEGWAYDPDDSGKSIWVHLYARPDSESAYRYVGAVFANQNHPDVNNTLGISGDHGFKVEVPVE